MNARRVSGAVAKERVDNVRRILESAADLDLNEYDVGDDDEGEDPFLAIEVAAYKGNEALVRVLLGHGALVAGR